MLITLFSAPLLLLVPIIDLNQKLHKHFIKPALSKQNLYFTELDLREYITN